MEIYLKDPEETLAFGEVLAVLYLNKTRSEKKNYSLSLFLYGKLGSGKSSLARGFIRSLTQETDVPSPSYLICNKYRCTEELADVNINHIDPYRLKRNQDIKELVDLNEIKKGIIILEHPQLTDLDKHLDSISTIKLTIEGHSHGIFGLGRVVKIDKDFLQYYGYYGIDFGVDVFDKTVTLDDFIRFCGVEKDITTLREIKSLKPENNISIDLDFVPDSKQSSREDVKKLMEEDPGKLLIMGVETSCDDTGIAVIDGYGNIVINYLIGQEDVHKQYRGVHPQEARKCHRKNLEIYMKEALQTLQEKYQKLPDVISFTIGPGLEVCLAEGVCKVYEISQKYQIPIVPTHHLESHIAVCRLPSLRMEVEYPFISVVVSGGHTFIAYAHEMGRYTLLSNTQDDSIGETFDKVGRELGIESVPAGKEVEVMATLANDRDKYARNMVKPVVKKKPFDQSYSGIKESVITLIKRETDKLVQLVESNQASAEEKEKLQETRQNIAAAFQESTTEYIVSKLKKLMIKKIPLLCQNKEIKPYNCIVVAGGVAANKCLRNKLDKIQEEFNVLIKYPPTSLCTDNGVMVAWNGVEKIRSGFLLNPIQVYDPEKKYEVRSRWKLWS